MIASALCEEFRLLGNHGPVVAGRDVAAACNVVDEQESTAKLAIWLRRLDARLLCPENVANLGVYFDVGWDD